MTESRRKWRRRPQDVIDRSENVRLLKNKTEERVAEEQTQDSHLNSSTKTDVDALEDEETWTMTIESKDRTAAELQQMEEHRAKYELKVEGFLRKGRNYEPLENYVPLSRETKPQDEANSSPGLPPNTAIPAEAASTKIPRTAREMPHQGQGSLDPQAKAVYNRLTMQTFKAQMTQGAQKYGGNPAMIPAPVKHQLQKNAQQQAMATIQRSSGYELSNEAESFYTAHSQMSAKLSSDSAAQSDDQTSTSSIGKSEDRKGNNSSRRYDHACAEAHRDKEFQGTIDYSKCPSP